MSALTDGLVFGLVRQDIMNGLAKYFTVTKIDFVPPTDTDQGPLQNDGSAAVAWKADCVDDKVFPDLDPSDQHFVAEGVTIVVPGDEGPTFRRYVDWNRIISQLGESHHRRGRGEPEAFRERESRKQAPDPGNPSD
jgi:hypothetical protein